MLELEFHGRGRPGLLRILCLGAHCDDIDIGCGGTLLKLLEDSRCAVSWVTFAATPERAGELRSSARRFLRAAQRTEVVVHAFRDSYFPAQYTAIKESFEPLKRASRPDLVFTHRRDDAHQDHRIVSELTWNAFRDHLVLEYEVPKWDGDLTTPNAYVQLRAKHVRAKIRHLLASYPSQRSKSWFDKDTFQGLMRLRGVEAGCQWAEGFCAKKIRLT